MKYLRAITIAVVFLFATTHAALAYVVYGPTITGIWGINPVTGTATKIYTFATTMTSIAAIAQRQSDGMIFFIDGNSGNDTLYRWDPSTPSTAPVKIGTTGTGIPYMPRLSFDPASGVLYGMDTNANPTIWTVDQNTGAATSTGKTVSGLPSGGGDFVIDTDGTWYIAVATTLYKTPTMGGTLSTIGTIGSTSNITGLALGAGNLVGIDTGPPSTLYTISKTNAATTNTGQTISDGSNTVGDLAGIFQPDLALTKTDDGPWTASMTGAYTLTATNIGNQTTSGAMTLTDAVPSGLTVNSVSGPAGWSCTTAQTVTCTSNAGTTLAPNASATFTVNITVSGSQTSITNNASITGGNVPSNLAVDGQASDTTSITQSSSGLVYIGPYNSGDANLGAQYTGSYDGIQTASNEYDFTAVNIPFTGSVSLANTSTTPSWTPSGAAVTASSVTFDVPNSLYFNNTSGGTKTVSLSVTAPSGWTAQVCADNAGTALCGGTTAGACASSTWQGSAAGQTATASCTQGKRTIGKTRFFVRYTTPASGLYALTRYDAIVTAKESATNTTNATHNELYSGFVALTKTVSVVSNGCPSGAAPTYPANGTCPGGVLLYTIDYRNIIAGAASESGLTWPQTSAGSFSITENGSAGGNTWGTFSNGLKEALVAGANGTTTFGDSTTGSIFTTATVGSTSFSDQVGGASFQLVPKGSSGTSQGTLTFRVVIK